MGKEDLKCKSCLRKIKFNKNGEPNMKDGLCPACQIEMVKGIKIDWDLKKKEFESKIEEIRGKGDFDGLVMLSGGKDSVYTAYLLSKVYHLKILGITIDNGFEYQSTFDNSSEIARKLSISHFIYRLPFEEMKSYYQFLLTEDELKLEDSSQICFFCGRLLKAISIKIAKQLNVAAVFSGHTEEQVRALGEEAGENAGISVRRRLIQTYAVNSYQKAIKLLDNKEKEEIKHLFIDNLEINQYDKFIYPLQYFEYKPMEISALLERELGWKPDGHFNKKYISSGCKMAKLMEHIASKNGSTTYVEREFSDQIRRGSMSKAEVLEVMESRVDNNEQEVKELIDLLELDSNRLFG
jgi:ExsB.